MSCGCSGFVVGRLATSGAAGVAVEGDAVLGGGGETVGVDGVAGDVTLLGGAGGEVAAGLLGALVGDGTAARGWRDNASSLLLSSSSWVESVVTDAVSASTR